MNRIPLVAGTVLIALLSFSAALADRVEVITPGGGGNAGLAPPTNSDASGTSAVEQPKREVSGNSGRSAYDATEVEAQPGLPTMHFGGATLSCRVAQSANDLVVINESLEPLPPGTRIKWQLTTEGKRGYFAIVGELGGGQSLVADNVLDGEARRDDICVARVI